MNPQLILDTAVKHHGHHTAGDVWCARSLASGEEQMWDGVDFGHCFRTRVFDGILPLIFISLSLFFLLITALSALYTLFRSRSTGRIRLDNTDVQNEAKENPLSPIQQAETAVLRLVAEKQSVDWLNPVTQKELLGSDAAVEADAQEAGKITAGQVVRAAWGVKKDATALVLSAGITAVLVIKTVKALKGGEDGRGWITVELFAWAWATALAIIKIALSYSHRLWALQHPTLPHRDASLWTATLERHLIPFYIIFTSLTSFFDFRTALLDYHSFPYGPTREHVRIEGVLFVLANVLMLLEIFAPRASRFASRKSSKNASSMPTGEAKSSTLPPPPELNASLFSAATWTYMEPFMLRAAFPARYNMSTLKMEDVPALRPDDNTARVLLAYRQSMRVLDARLTRLPTFLRRFFLGKDEQDKTVEDLSLAYKLTYHFFSDLVAQNTYSLVRVGLNGVPPLMLKGILNHLGRRSRGEPAPTHVAVLYAWVLFVSTCVGSLGSSQSLFIGRRICIRLRSIIVGEVFTKALRRKDQAGSSTSSASAAPTRPSSPAPGAEAEAAPKDEEEEVKKIEEELDQASTGKVMQLISIDTFRLSEICAYLHFLITEMPLSIIIILWLLYRLLGVSALPGVATFLILAPINGWIGKMYNKYQLQLLAAADERMTLSSEVISQVKMVKFFAWEHKFLEKMDVVREKELGALWRRALAASIGGTVMFASPVIVSVVVFVVHTKVMKAELTAETAFTALALFNVLRNPLEGFTDMFVNTLQALVSLRRIDDYLHEEETHKYSMLAEEPSAAAQARDVKVGIVHGTFTWADEDEAREDPSVFRIKDVNVKFPEGKLSIVLGPVGSGKTTLLLSLLGETNRLSGAAFLPSPVIRSNTVDPSILTESTAYAAQQAWLVSASIKDNIVFGSQFNEKRYRDTLEACALVTDLKQFELGDDTEVGEKGTVLSGGQKARISLARAVYSSARHVLLDDILSAVDSHTAQHLVESVLASSSKLMRYRTCILVTHAVDLVLPVASYVVTMDHGSVVSAGAPENLPKDLLLELEKEQDAYAAKHKPQDEGAGESMIEQLADGDEDSHAAAEKKKRAEELKLIKEETSSEGAVSMEVYRYYFRAFGGVALILVTVSIFLLAQASDILVNISLRQWASSYDNREIEPIHLASPLYIASSLGFSSSSGGHNVSATGIVEDHALDSDFWLVAYCLLALLNILAITARVIFYSWRGLIASRKIYAGLIRSILGAPTRFFDTTPTGRILNRLSKDQETIDQDFAPTSMYLSLEILMVLGIVGVISVGIPAFLPAAAVITLVYVYMGQIYVSASRELKRAESVTKSPIFSVFGEALQGVSTIRAYGDASRFMKDIFHLLDENNRPFFALWQANRWLSVRVDSAGGFVALVTALFVIFSTGMDAARAGFLMSFALAWNDRLLWTVRLWGQVEVQANSIERVQEYSTLEQESTGGVAPPAAWPSRGGTISVNGLTASYAPNLPPVLKNVSFEVKGGEKIGIVGRTGSGKSTLGISFFRFVEPTSGNITIDGININTLKLEDLRSRLVIVAQDASLFAGTLRFNLDPFEQYSDADIWNALSRVQMAAPGATGVTPLPTPGPSRAASITSEGEETVTEEETARYVVKSLDMTITEGGKNFSAGQRQLLALARGILKLKNSSILILDESTASLDRATDEHIQRTIREEMYDASLLVVAHRIATVIDFDKVLVLDAGEVVEYDSPIALLEKEGSAFASLCQKTGEWDLLKGMAEKAAAAREEGLKGKGRK